MIADGSPQAALEERLVEAIEAASTSVALEGTLHGLTQAEHTVIVVRPGSAAAKPKARGRRRGARPEPRARAPTPASDRGCAASGDAGELGPSRRWVSPSPPAARDFWRISILT